MGNFADSHGSPLPGGAEAEWQPGLLCLIHPPTHPYQKIFHQKKLKFIEGARNWRSILSTKTFFFGL